MRGSGFTSNITFSLSSMSVFKSSAMLAGFPKLCTTHLSHFKQGQSCLLCCVLQDWNSSLLAHTDQNIGFLAGAQFLGFALFCAYKVQQGCDHKILSGNIVPLYSITHILIVISRVCKTKFMVRCLPNKWGIVCRRSSMGAVTAGKMTFSTERLEKTIHAEGSKNELSTIVSSRLFVTFSPYVLCQAADQPSWQKQLLQDIERLLALQSCCVHLWIAVHKKTL